MTSVVAIVPARGGSKSIPRKNLRHLGGHPLLAYSIAAGLQSELVDRVIVSTDDEEIAATSRRYGAEVPFLRPATLAGDEVTDLPVFVHALRWLEREQRYTPEVVVQLRPTSPFRPVSCVDRAVRLLLSDDTLDCVRGVTPSGENPFKTWLVKDGRLVPLLREPPEAYNLPRQVLPPTFWQTGHVEAIRRATILEQGSMTGRAIAPLVIEQPFAIDIDTEANWRAAEWSLAQGIEIVRPGQPS